MTSVNVTDQKITFTDSRRNKKWYWYSNISENMLKTQFFGSTKSGLTSEWVICTSIKKGVKFLSHTIRGSSIKNMIQTKGHAKG